MEKIYRAVFIILFMALISPVFSQHRNLRKHGSTVEQRKSSHEPSVPENKAVTTVGLSARMSAVPAAAIVAKPNYYVTTEEEPWGSNSNIDAMNNSFGAGNWARLNFTDADIMSIFNASTKFIFLEGSDDNANELNAFLTANLTAIEGWVHAGGRLLLNAAPNEGGNINFGFDGTTLVYSSAQDEVNVIGPIGAQPFTLSASTYYGNSFSHSHVTGTGMNPLIMGSDKIVLTEKVWGDGIVLFGGMTTSNYHSPQPDADHLRANIMYYIANTSNEPAAPDAEFMISSTNVIVNREVSLIDISAHYPTSRTWTITPATFEFTNGTNAQSNNPKLKFTAPGLYSVTLTVSNDLGQDQLVRENYVTVTSPGNFYWVGGSGYWNDYAAHWATTSGGTEFHTRVPGEEDNVYFDANSFTAEGQSIDLNGNDVSSLNANFSGVTHKPELRNGDFEIYGSLLVPNPVIFNIDDLELYSPDQVTINTSGAEFQEDLGIYIYGRGTFDIVSPLELNYLTIEGGFVFTNGHMITVEDLYIYDELPTFVDFENSELHISEYFEIYKDTDAPIAANFKLFVGKEGHYSYIDGNDLQLDATLNTNVHLYTNVEFTRLVVTPGTVLNLGSRTHTVSALELKGTTDHNITITNGTLSKTSGIVAGTSLNLTNVIATGGASFYADKNSVDNGGNTGWNFSTKDAQTITFNSLANKVYGDAAFSLTASSTSSLAVAFTVVSGPATLSGNTVTINGTGLVTVKASQDGDDSFLPAEEVTQRFTVIKAAQTLDFTLGSLVYGQAPITLTATPGQSGNPVAFSIAGGSGSIAGNTLTITGAGNLVISATQAGNDNYEAVVVTKEFIVAKASQTITFAVPTAKTFGDEAFDVTATGGASGNAITFSVVSGPATVTNSTVTLTGAGVVVLKATQAGNANYFEASETKEITVAKAAQAIAFATLTNKTFGDAAFNVTATGGAGSSPVTFTIVSGPATLTGNAVTLTGSGTVTIKASQAGDANYLAAADVEQSFCINPAKPLITVAGLDTETPVLTSSSNDANQWYNNGVAIAGATNKTFTVSAAGTYTVIASAGTCASAASEGQVLIITGVEGALDTKVSTYPNPVVNELIIDLSSLSGQNEALIAVYDMSGKLMTSLKGKGTVTLPMESYRQGQYTVVVRIGTQQIAKHIIKK